MAEDNEKRIPKTVYLTQDMIDFIGEEGVRDRRPWTRQAEYFLEEMRRTRIHNRKAMSDRAKNTQ